MKLQLNRVTKIYWQNDGYFCWDFSTLMRDIRLLRQWIFQSQSSEFWRPVAMW